MQNSNHDNIIQLIGILMDTESNCLGYIMPYMPIGSLHDSDIFFGKNYFSVIHDKSQKYDQKQIKSWITKICYGLSYLHGKKIIHRDIKPSKSN